MKLVLRLLLLEVLLTSCAGVKLASPITPTFSLSSTPTITLTPTYAPVPTATPIPTKTPFPSDEAKQLIQKQYSIIQPENASHIYQLVRYHRFEIEDESANPQHQPDNMYSVAFSPNSYLLAFGSSDRAGLWNIEKYLTQPFLEESKPTILTDSDQDGMDVISSVTFSPDGKFIAIGSEIGSPWGKTYAQVWDVTTKQLQTLTIWVSSPRELSFSPDGSVIGMVSGNSVEIWDWHKGYVRPEYMYPIPEEYLPSTDSGYYNTSLAYSSDGKMIATGVSFFSNTQGHTKKSVVFLWDINTGQILHVLEKGNKSSDINSLTFNPDNSIIVSGDWDGKVRLWDVKNGNLLSTLETGGYTHAVTFSPDGRILAAGNQDGTIKLWDTKTLKLLHTIQAHIIRTTEITFSFDGRFIASSGYDGTVSIWGVHGR